MPLPHKTAFTVNTQRTAPSNHTQVRVSFQSQPPHPIMVVSKVSGLKRTTEVVRHRDGGDQSTPRHAPGRTSFEPIPFERGVTFAEEFEEWANAVHSTDGADSV